MPLLLRAACGGAGIALAGGILLLVLLCAVCLSLDDPSRFARPLALCALFPSALLSGILTAHRAKGRGLLSGACGGGLFCAALWTLSLCLPENCACASCPSALGMTGACLALALFGGYAVTHRKPKKRRLSSH